MSYLKYIFLFLLYLAGISEPSAAEFQIKLSQFDRLADEEKYNVAQWGGIQFSYGNDFYGFASYEKAQLVPLWGIGDLRLFGAGFGYRYQLTKKIRLYGQLGAYYADQEYEGRHNWCPGCGASEGIDYYMHDKYGFTTPVYEHPDEYMIEYNNAIAGEVGIELIQPLAKNTAVGFGLGYRSMKIKQLLRIMWDKYDFDNTGVCWEDGRAISFSAMRFSLFFNHVF